MPHQVFFAVMAAAVLHASWNAVIKTSHDRFVSIGLLGLLMGAIALAALAFVDVPRGETWLWIVLSGVLHTGYKLFLVRAYAAGDLSQVYPLARGTAPMITAVCGYLFLQEALPVLSVAGIVVLSLGIWLMSMRGGAALARLAPQALAYGLGTSVFIASYTLTDGIGVRTAQTAASYAAWMFVLDGFFIAIVCALVRGPAVFAAMGKELGPGLAAGAMSIGAYGLIIWAMARAPIGAVAALRETSILFAMMISAVVLKERMTGWRAAAGLLIVGGVVAIRSG